jgi:hypothetical protein
MRPLKTLIVMMLFLFVLVCSQSVLGALTDGIVSYYTFDSNISDVTPDSLGYQNGTLSSAINITGKIGWAYNITKFSSSYISFGSPSRTDFQSNAAFSFNIWLKVSSNTGQAICLINHNDGTGLGDSALICFNVTIPNALQSYNGVIWYNISTNPGLSTIDNLWKMLTITFNGTHMKGYVNGLLNGTVSYSYTGGASYILKLGGWNSDSNYNFAGGIDEFGIWNRSLNSSEITVLYNGGTGLTYPFVFTISDINCTSCSPPAGSTIPPYETDDTTPTFEFITGGFIACRISDMNINYTTMGSSRNCDSGDSRFNHTCTLIAQDALVDYNASVYIGCSNIESANASTAFPMLISSLETPNSTEAIQQGIENSVIGQGATVYTNQKVYLRALNGSNVAATVAKVAVYGNQRWLFNYVNATGTTLGLFNLTPVVYSLDMKNISVKAIRGNVTALINSTKI